MLRRFMDAFERADAAALTALLMEDARQTMPPAAFWVAGRSAIGALHAWAFGGGSPGGFRMVPTAANRQLAAASYRRPYGEGAYRLMGVNVLRIEAGAIIALSASEESSLIRHATAARSTFDVKATAYVPDATATRETSSSTEPRRGAMACLVVD